MKESKRKYQGRRRTRRGSVLTATLWGFTENGSDPQDQCHWAVHHRGRDGTIGLGF